MMRTPPDAARRRLLAAARNLGAATAAATVLGPAAVAGAGPAQRAAQPRTAEPHGYHETERIRRYYQLARY